MKNKLIFNLNDAGNSAEWRLPGTGLCETADGDFWRLIGDDGYYMELTFRSSQQQGAVTKCGNKTTVVYDRLITDNDMIFDVTLTIEIIENGFGYTFAPTIENRDDVRINEVQCPYVDINRLVGEREKDVLYRPRGLGERMENPWRALDNAHTEYMSADYDEIKSTLIYPATCTMTWLGVQSDKYFLYIGKQDERTHACCLLSAIGPRHIEEKRLINSVCQYPGVTKGEKLDICPVVVSMYEGDWREGADFYGEFARKHYFKPVEPREWIKTMTGWQRIICRHQYGEIFFKFSELPRVYLEGKECGLDTILLFGWWKGRFDNGYPHYEVDEELGGAEGLRAAIAEIRRLGGHVILYNNGILIDKNTDFYREKGHEVAKLDIDGNEYLMNYKFEKDGTYLRNFGYKSFVEACQATDEWIDKLEENGRYKLSFDPDGIFYDQVGGISRLCFNENHKHGKRIDDELHFRRENLARLRALLGPGQAIGTEHTNDSISGCVDYLHGCDYANYCKRSKNDPVKNLYPALFRRTFPEIIMTNRFTHDCRPGWKNELNYSFIHGFRFDVAIFRCRKVGIAGLPEYAEHVKKIMAKKAEYSLFFYNREAKYVCDTVLDLPAGIFYAEYTLGEERMFALRSENAEETEVTICGQTLTLEPYGIDCIVTAK